MREIGFFGGSFDPIHFGHINLALQMLEIHGLAEVLFCPAFCSPFKSENPPIASPRDRLAMLKLALAKIPQFRIISLEIDRGGSSYTVDTIRKLEKEGDQLRLILSADAAVHFNRWKEPEALMHLAPPLIGVRKGVAIEDLPEKLKKGLTPTKIMEISSTEVRERLKKKLYCGHLVPGKALDYIRIHGLYS